MSPPTISGVTFHHLHRVLATAVLATLAAAPATADKKLKPVYPITTSAHVDAGLSILVVPPKITLRSYKVGRTGREVELPTTEIAEWIRQTEIGVLQERGFSLSLDNPVVGDDMADLIEASESLVRRPVQSEDSLAVLQKACKVGEGVAVLAQHLKVKAAPKGSWDAWSGGMKVGMSNAHLRGVLFDCQTFERLWEGEMYIRMLPEVGNARFEAAVIGIFGTLDTEGN